MSERMHYFTLKEAQGLLPQVAPLVEAAQLLKRKLDANIFDWEKKKASGAVSMAEEALAQAQAEFLASQINASLAKIQAWGAEPKDLDAGLVDFPSRVDGEDVYLCWKLGEPAIAFWHGFSEGFSGRKPLKTISASK